MISIPVLYKRTINARPKGVQIVCALLQCASLAFATHAYAEPDSTTNSSQPESMDTVKNSLTEQSLDVYDLDDIFYLDESNNPFIARYQSAVTPSGLGVLLLPEANRDLLNPSIFFESYRQLSSKRWNTLGIFMPDSPTNDSRATAAPTSDKSSDPDAENDQSNPPNNETVQPDATNESEDAKRLDASIEYLIANGSTKLGVIVGNKNQLAAFEHLITRSEIAAIVLWRTTINQKYAALLKSLNQQGIKILDIVANTRDPEWRAERKLIFKRAGYKTTGNTANPLANNYAQMASPDGKIGTIHSTRRIQHWLVMNIPSPQ